MLTVLNLTNFAGSQEILLTILFRHCIIKEILA